MDIGSKKNSKNKKKHTQKTEPIAAKSSKQDRRQTKTVYIKLSRTATIEIKTWEREKKNNNSNGRIGFRINCEGKTATTKTDW